jgi:hypothetical protein
MGLSSQINQNMMSGGHIGSLGVTGPLADSISDFTAGRLGGPSMQVSTNHNVKDFSPVKKNINDESKFMNMSNFMKDFQDLKERKENLLKYKAMNGN